MTSLPTLPTYGYEEGLLSNSMLQAAIVCPLKYRLQYVDKVKLDEGYKLYDATYVGRIVHYCIERHDDNREAALETMWDLLTAEFGAGITARTKGLMFRIEEALEKTREDGLRWGRVYKAPEMAGYWKKNYTGLDTLMERLNSDMEYQTGAKFAEPFSKLVLRMLVSLKNWPALRIAEPLAVEVKVTQEVGPNEAKQKMSGTIDRIERRGDDTDTGHIAICDYKTGKWAYSRDKVVNSDQLGLYDRLLTLQGYTVVEWTIYDLYVNQVIRVVPNKAIREAFDRRLNTNLRYFKQLTAMFGTGIEAPVPAGMSYRIGCPCVFALSGHCSYGVWEDMLEMEVDEV